jgi:formate dehydrogenase gamma subunit
MNRLCLFGMVVFSCVALAATTGRTFVDEDCALCHGDPQAEAPQVATADMTGGVHEGFSCTDCHAGITDLPHAEDLPPTDCGGCHSDVAETYHQHGRGRVGVSPFVPGCADCHGQHGILPAEDRDSPVNPLNLPATCGHCHEDQELIDRLNIKFKHPIRVYEKSVHGRATAGGIHTAATCNDCHSTGGTAHLILPPGDSRSTINHFNIPHTCGKCHGAIEQDYWEGIHGELTARGEVDSPTCTHCHGEHAILATDDPRSPVSPYRLAEATCSPCHESASLNEKYDLPTGRLQSFIDSYHGTKSMAGDKTVANCASCHGAHRILPAADPRSSINPQNLPETCGGCHPGISPAIARTPIHATATGARTGWPNFFRVLYIWAIVLIIGSMVLHWLLDLIRQIRNVLRSRPQVRRMEPNEVIQHLVLAVSFTVLVISGFSLRFYDAWWSHLLFGHEGGSSVRGTIHRVAGVVMLLGAVWHVVFLLTPRGRAFLQDMLPRRHDFQHFFQMMRYNLGRSEEEPVIGRFSYVEKAEYWALVWGTVVMGVTGLFLWFENVAVQLFPKGLLEVFLVIHYYEAWLAFLAILIWHMYATVFNPRVYPMNPSWLTGQMPRDMFEEEHPAAVPAGERAESGRTAGPGTGR